MHCSVISCSIEYSFAVLIRTLNGHDVALSVSSAGLNPISDHYLLHRVQIACGKHNEVVKLDDELSGEQNLGCKIAGVVQGVT